MRRTRRAMPDASKKKQRVQVDTGDGGNDMIGESSQVEIYSMYEQKNPTFLKFIHATSMRASRASKTPQPQCVENSIMECEIQIRKSGGTILKESNLGAGNEHGKLVLGPVSTFNWAKRSGGFTVVPKDALLKRTPRGNTCIPPQLKRASVPFSPNFKWLFPHQSIDPMTRERQLMSEVVRLAALAAAVKRNSDAPGPSNRAATVQCSRFSDQSLAASASQRAAVLGALAVVGYQLRQGAVGDCAWGNASAANSFDMSTAVSAEGQELVLSPASCHGISFLPERISNNTGVHQAGARIADMHLRSSIICSYFHEESEDLNEMCRAAAGRDPLCAIDSATACVGLVVILNRHPLGRRLLVECGVDDLAVEQAVAMTEFAVKLVTQRLNDKRRICDQAVDQSRPGEDSMATVSSWMKLLTSRQMLDVAPLMTIDAAYARTSATLSAVSHSIDAVSENLELQSALEENAANITRCSRALTETPGHLLPKLCFFSSLATGSEQVRANGQVFLDVVWDHRRLGRLVLFRRMRSNGVDHAAAPPTSRELTFLHGEASMPLEPLVYERLASLARNSRHPVDKAKSRRILRNSTVQPEFNMSCVDGFACSVVVEHQWIDLGEGTLVAAQILESAKVVPIDSEKRACADQQVENGCGAAVISETPIEARHGPEGPANELAHAIRSVEVLQRFSTASSLCVRTPLVPRDELGQQRTDAHSLNVSPLPIVGTRTINIVALGPPSETKETKCAVVRELGTQDAMRTVDVVRMLLRQKNQEVHCLQLILAATNQMNTVGALRDELVATIHGRFVRACQRPTCIPESISFGTAVDTVVGGRFGLLPHAAGTPHESVSGSTYDTGRCSEGMEGVNMCCDERRHGVGRVESASIAESASEVAKQAFVETEPGVYSRRPRETRGEPHGLIVGVHAALSRLVDALEAVDAARGSRTPSTTEVLAYESSKFDQFPPVPCTSDFSTCQRTAGLKRLANPSSGMAELIGGTDARDALAIGPLFPPTDASRGMHRSGASHLSAAHQAITAVALVALLFRGADECATSLNAIDRLFLAMRGYILDKPGDVCPNAEALSICWIYLNVIFSNGVVLGDEVIDAAFAETHTLTAKQKNSNLNTILSSMQDSSRLSKSAAAFTAPFFRKNGVFDCLRPLLVLLLDKVDAPDDGRAAKQQRQAVLQTALMSGRWQFDSVDGTAAPKSPSIIAGLADHTHINRNHCDYLFVDDEKRKLLARSSIIGILPFQLRQITMLLMGANLTNIKVQVLRNLGQLVVRGSSDPTILQFNGDHRQCKQSSPVQLQGDFSLNGTMEGRISTSFRSRRAFDGNFKLLTPLFTPVQKPMPFEKRYKAAVGANFTAVPNAVADAKNLAHLALATV